MQQESQISAIAPECPSPIPQSSRVVSAAPSQATRTEAAQKWYYSSSLKGIFFSQAGNYNLLSYQHCPLLPVQVCGLRVHVSMGEISDHHSTGGIHTAGISSDIIHIRSHKEMEKSGYLSFCNQVWHHHVFWREMRPPSSFLPFSEKAALENLQYKSACLPVCGDCSQTGLYCS